MDNTEKGDDTTTIFTDSSVHEGSEHYIQTVPAFSAQDSMSLCKIDICIKNMNAELEDQQIDAAGSREGLVNTPASFFTDWSEYKALASSTG